jgi:hypothetical protein
MSVGNSSQMDMLTQYAERGFGPEKQRVLGGGDTSELVLRLLSEGSGFDDPISTVLVAMLLRQKRRSMMPASTPGGEEGGGQASSAKQDPPEPPGTQGANLILSRVSSVLGACSICCGLSEDCRHCQGCGTPGWQSPKKELVSWVLPALQQLGKRVLDREADSSA